MKIVQSDEILVRFWEKFVQNYHLTNRKIYGIIEG
mgnify:CR=1 FL=1